MQKGLVILLIINALLMVPILSGYFSAKDDGYYDALVAENAKLRAANTDLASVNQKNVVTYEKLRKDALTLKAQNDQWVAAAKQYCPNLIVSE